MERGSIVRETKVAVITASSSGAMNDRSRPVSSIMSTTAEMGPCVVAASTAPALRTAGNPRGTPGQSRVPAKPSTAPSNAPRVKVGGEETTGRTAAQAQQGSSGLEEEEQQQEPAGGERAGEEQLREVSAEVKDSPLAE